MPTKNFIYREPIVAVESFMNEMVKLGFSRYSERFENLETFVESLNLGENWFSNGVIEIKIMKDYDGSLTFFNFRRSLSPMVEALAHAAAR